MAKHDIKEYAGEMFKMSEERGTQFCFEFIPLLEKYLVQLEILDGLEASLKEHGIQVTKTYVKGRENLYSNPAISDYNRTSDSANKTLATIMKVLKNYGADETSEEVDPLISMINGGNE